MERVVGIGGYFIRAADPAGLGAWYRECLGLAADEMGLWTQEPGPTAMLAQLRAHGADVADETQEMAAVGRFGWVTEPEGNRIELWQPA